MSLSNEFDSLISDSEFIIAEVVADLYAELIKRTPVDTGQLKASWNLDKLSDGSWLLSSNLQYADIIFRGRRMIMGKQVGSLQLPDGVYPIIASFNSELENRLKGLKR